MNIPNGQIDTRSLSFEELSKMSGLSMTSVTDAVQNKDLVGMDYIALTAVEIDNVEKRVKSILNSDTIIKAGIDQIDRWRLGWQEILKDVRLNGLSEMTLTPQYFKHDVLRFNGNYIWPIKHNFENRVFRMLKAIYFEQYLAPLSHVIEFGCGTGANLLQIHKRFPEIQLTGCDWAEPSQELINEINIVSGSKIKAVNFNMFTLEGKEKLDFTNSTGVVTFHAMEQLGKNFRPFLAMLIDKRPAVCVHLEPIVEFYDKNLVFDNYAINYHNKRNYLNGFLQALNKYEKYGKIKVLQTHRCRFGSIFQEAYSLVAWKVV